MKTPTMLDTVRSLLGVPACAIPLSVCKPAKTYLLDRAGIPSAGTAILFAVPYLVTADVEARNQAENNGFTGVLLKPITLEKLQKLFRDSRSQ